MEEPKQTTNKGEEVTPASPLQIARYVARQLRTALELDLTALVAQAQELEPAPGGMVEPWIRSPRPDRSDYVRCPDHRNGGATMCPRGGPALQEFQRRQWDR